MALFNAPAPVLPLYSRAPVAPSLPRRIAVMLLQLAAAAVYGVAVVALPPQYLFVLILPIVVCLLVALWLMPDRGVFPLTAVERSMRVLLVLMIIWPSYVAVVLPGLPWLTPTRMMLFVVTFLFMYSVSTSSMLRRHLAVVARASPLLWVAFLAFQVAMIVSMPFTHAFTTTIKAYIDNQLRLTELFFIGCLVFAWRGAPTRTIGWVLVLAFVCALDGYVEMKLEYPPWANHIPSFMKIDDAMLAIILGPQARTADGLYRVRGPFGNSLIFAEFLALCMPFIIHWFLTGRTLLLRVAMAILFVMFVFSILSTQSRLGLVGTLVGIGVYVPLWALRQWRADRTSIIGPSILFGGPLVALGLVGVVLSSHTLSNRVFGGGAQAASTAARAEQRRLALPKIAANPIGHGLGQSGSVLGYANQAGQTTVDNHFITTFLDIGVLGGFGFYGMFLIAAWLGARVYLSTDERESELAGPLGVMCFVFVVLKFVLSEENNHALVMFLLGMMVALWARHRRLFDPDNLFPPLPQPR